MTYEALERQEVDEVRSMMESMFDDLGVDIDLSDLGSEMNQIARKMAEMSDTVRQKMQDDGSRQPGHKTKRQLKKEERMRQDEEVRKKNTTSIYRQLAKVLHPDLEPGPAEAHRLDIMIREMETSLALLRNENAEKEVRLAIKQYRAATRMRRVPIV